MILHKMHAMSSLMLVILCVEHCVHAGPLGEHLLQVFESGMPRTHIPIRDQSLSTSDLQYAHMNLVLRSFRGPYGRLSLIFLRFPATTYTTRSNRKR